MTQYNHAMTLAYEVVSQHRDMPTEDEQMVALRKRMAQLESDAGERIEALRTEFPFDTYEMEMARIEDDPKTAQEHGL